jgi:cyclopropane fatty-acyl-phospholipid synthase-like methyltransferase
MLTAAKLPDRFTNGFDFVYSFDVLPHVDLHTIHTYFGEIKRVLRADGFAFLHTANLAAPLGWDRFVVQSKYTAGGFYCKSCAIASYTCIILC